MRNIFLLRPIWLNLRKYGIRERALICGLTTSLPQQHFVRQVSMVKKELFTLTRDSPS